MKRLACDLTLAVLTIAFLLGQTAAAAEWSIPVAGNAFHTAPQPSREGMRRGGGLRWKNAKSVYSTFFRADRPADLSLKLLANAVDAPCTVRVKTKDESVDIAIEKSDQHAYEIGPVKVGAGYVRVEVQGVDRDGEAFGDIHAIVVTSETKGLKLDYVKNNQGNMYYWGRRGPSVHLRYQVPKDTQLQYAYSEVTVPPGQDPIGSFFMANGFGEGYFGIQVNGPKERRVLFSVWSPFKTNDPSSIPKDQRIVALGRGRDVHVGEFGNEGSGGQSYLVYPWKAGVTYRFLTEVTPQGNDNTIYTAWFGDKSADEWRLIARFRRPKTDTHLRGYHSFLESFSPVHGHIERRARYGNVWVCDVSGKWHECTQARFSVDATGRGRHRLDFEGGSEGPEFFLRNCGFFDQTGRPGTTFRRASSAKQRPKIDFSELPSS